MWKKKILQTGQCGKNKFSTLHTKFSTFKCGKIFLKKERRLEVYLYIYSNILNNQKMIQGLQLAVLQEILLFKRWGKFLAVLSSDGKNQWPRPPSLAPSGQFTLRSPGDAAIGPAASRPVLHAVFPQAPNYGGTPSRNLIHDLPADKTLIIFPSCPGDTALPGLKFDGNCVERTPPGEVKPGKI